MRLPDDLVEVLANVYLAIQDCPDGLEAGRAEAIELFKLEDALRGTDWTPALVTLLDGVDAHIHGRAS